MAEVTQGIEHLRDDDDDARAVLIRGNGRAFCAGDDLKATGCVGTLVRALGS